MPKIVTLVGAVDVPLVAMVDDIMGCAGRALLPVKLLCRGLTAQTVENQFNAVKQDTIGPSKRNWRVSGKALANCCCAAQLNNKLG